MRGLWFPSITNPNVLKPRMHSSFLPWFIKQIVSLLNVIKNEPSDNMIMFITFNSKSYLRVSLWTDLFIQSSSMINQILNQSHKFPVSEGGSQPS